MVQIYREEDASLDSLAGKKLGVIGYGNQGSAQAKNLRDSGLEVVVGNREDPAKERAKEDGFETTGIAEAASEADVVFVLIPDEVQKEVFAEQIEPGLEEGDCLVFASGYNVYYEFVNPPNYVDVVMVAPRMIGEGVRNLYQSGKGFPCFIGVNQDYSDLAQKKALAIGKAIGGTKGGAIASSFREETLIDLFAEQFLWAGINKLCETFYDKLVEMECSPEAIATELYLSGEMVEVAEAMIETGFFKQLELHSQTSQYGQLSRGDRVITEEVEEEAEEILEEIRDGEFAREWETEQIVGKPTLKKLKKAAFAHPLNEIEEELK